MAAERSRGHGLLALLLSIDARKPARRAADSGFVPLSAQDTGLWSAAMLAEAEACLHRAAAHGTEAASALLGELSPDAVATYQPYWVLQAPLGLDRADALASALALTSNPAAQALLLERWGDG